MRVAHCRVREDRVEHFALMQEKVWNPAMAGSPGMLRGVFGEAPGSEFLVLSMWQSAAEHGKYRSGAGGAAAAARPDRGGCRGAGRRRRRAGTVLDGLTGSGRGDVRGSVAPS